MLTSPQIEWACAIATRAHAGQLDKIKVPYIHHPAMVADFVQQLPVFAAAEARTQEDAVAAAWLHDVVEDTDETSESLRAAGINDRTVEAVVALTRTTGVSDDDYYARITMLPLAHLVKTADLASNLAPERVARLEPEKRRTLATRYSHALAELGVDRSVITELHANRPSRARTAGGTSEERP